MSEVKIIEVSETQHGEWIERKWSDGCVTLHRRDADSVSIQQGKGFGGVVRRRCGVRPINQIRGSQALQAQ